MARWLARLGSYLLPRSPSPQLAIGARALALGVGGVLELLSSDDVEEEEVEDVVDDVAGAVLVPALAAVCARFLSLWRVRCRAPGATALLLPTGVWWAGPCPRRRGSRRLEGPDPGGPSLSSGPSRRAPRLGCTGSTIPRRGRRESLESSSEVWSPWSKADRGVVGCVVPRAPAWARLLWGAVAFVASSGARASDSASRAERTSSGPAASGVTQGVGRVVEGRRT